ncbi:MAG: hypothetical protein ACTHNW_01675 [Mucilaginibacter sp.]
MIHSDLSYKKALFILLLLFNSLFAYCQRSFIQNLDWKAQITFPDTPKTEFSNEGVYYIYQDNKLNLYFAQVLTINADSLESSKTNHVFEVFISNTISPLKGYNLHENHIKKDNIDGVNFSFTCEKKGIKLFGYQQVFVVNNKLISYSMFLPDSLSENDPFISSYFDSFRFTRAKAEQMDSRFHLIAGIIMLTSCIFLTTLILFFVKKSQRKKIKTYSPDNFE